MSLKILFFPTVIILAVILVIGYIQPDIETIFAKRSEKEVKMEDLRKAELIYANITALNKALDGRQEAESFIKRYFPQSIDQERALDIVNFLAQQTGVVVTDIDMIKNERPRTEAVGTVGAGVDPTEVSVSTVTEAPPEVPESYRVGIVTMGTYENLRSFFDRLYRTDRFRVLRDLKLSDLDLAREGEGGEIIPPDFLKGEIVLDFLYLPKKNSGNALTKSLFQQSELDFSSANRLIDFVNSPVGDLAPSTLGRNNPFQTVP